MSPQSSFGDLSTLVKNEGFEVAYKVYNAFAGDDDYATAKSVGSLSSSIADVLANNFYDWVLLAGDRSEQLATAVTASFMHTPIAHIQAGERSGNIDGISRHVIGKLAHLHFAANMDAYNRLIDLGEEEWRVKLTGAPQLDELFGYRDNKGFLNKFGLVRNKFFVFLFHSDTEYLIETREILDATLAYLNRVELPIIYICPNNDAGGGYISKKIKGNILKKDFFFDSLPRNEFLTLLKNCKAIIGNSSCGLLEAPVFKTPAINIGLRQKDRFFEKNVLHCGFDLLEIDKAIRILDSQQFKEQLDGVQSAYGEEPAACKILEQILKVSSSISRDMILHRKITK
jgi:GDP/UDP-N,N'-diacetylbacillosamine 2-epimerase (hydrolysing)